MRQIALAFALLIFGSGSAFALEYQFGAEAAALSSTIETQGTTAFIPFIAVGPEFDYGFSVLLEVLYLNYSATKPTSNNTNPNTVTVAGTLNVTGIGYAAVLQKKFAPVALRLGGGVIEYQYKSTIDSAEQSNLQAHGVTGLTESFRNAEGTQTLAGVDVAITDHLSAGLEYRSVVVHSIVDLSANLGGVPASATATANLTHTWTALRVLMDF